MKRWIGPLGGCGLLALCPCLGLGDPAPTAGAANPTIASGLLASAVADADSAGWVHEVTLDTGDGHRVNMVDDIGASSGRQVIDDNGGHMTVLVIDGSAYVDGDAEGLEKALDAPSQDATEFAGHWLSIPPTNQLFGPVSDAVTLRSDFSQARINGPLKRGGEVRMGGSLVVPITGTMPNAPHHAKVTATLYVSTGAHPLPVEYRASGDGLTSVTHWTDWGRSVLLTAPSDAVSLGGGGGSGTGVAA